ncbi:hypothetical protein EXIGLDRAFT_744972 [Exidia glandulosa HHB12029]|uniref:Uncharacterized protein n=1 Tax=Exidia glandulosa HHB12029 TaxID=1314781 RepID=A0A165P4E0_EXIGL|nr:hypothetical protein EXIGLDRAFT_744972 [Exidia glandulosa HHB12029]
MGLVVDLLDTVAKLLGATPSPSTPPPEDPTTPPTDPSTDPPPPPTSTPPPPTSTRTTTVAPPTSTTKPTTTAKPPSTSSSPAGTTPAPSAPASPSPGGGASGSSTTTRQVPHPIALPHDPNPGDDGDGTAPSDPNAPADPNAPSDPNGTQPTSDPAGSTLTLPGHSASQSWPTAGTWIPNTSMSSPGVEESGGSAGGKGRIMLSKGAIAAISITSFLLFLLALVCCVRCFFVRRRRNRAQSPSHWATTRPSVLFTRRHTESGMDFVTPRTSSERASSLASDEYARTNLFFSDGRGPPPSWSKASATQQRRMLKHPNGSESEESYGVPLPDDERLVTPVQQPEMSQLQAHVQFASVPPPPPVSYRPQPSGWAYHPNTPLLSASTVSHSNSHSHSPAHSHSYGHGLDSPTSSLRGLPDHSNVDLEAVAFTSESTLPYDRAISPFNGPRSDTDTPTSYTTSPTIRATSPTTRTGAISPFITVIRHPDGHEELGADLDEPTSPRVKTPPPVALAPTGLGVGGGGMVVRAVTPVSPLFATSFAQADADPFASPLDGAVPVHGPIAR